MRTRALLLCGLLCGAASSPCLFAADKSIVLLEVFPNAISVAMKSGGFAGLHSTKQGDTFESLSQEFYGTTTDADLLAQAADMHPKAKLAPGTRVYMVMSVFRVPFDQGKRALQLDEALKCAERMDRKDLGLKWDLDIKFAVGDGSTVRYEATRIAIAPLDGSAGELLVDFPPGTTMVEVLKGKATAAQALCR